MPKTPRHRTSLMVGLFEEPTKDGPRWVARSPRVGFICEAATKEICLSRADSWARSRGYAGACTH